MPALGPWEHPARGLQEFGMVGLEFEEQLRFCFQGILMVLSVTWCPLEISVKPHASLCWVCVVRTCLWVRLRGGKQDPPSAEAFPCCLVETLLSSLLQGQWCGTNIKKKLNIHSNPLKSHIWVQRLGENNFETIWSLICCRLRADQSSQCHRSLLGKGIASNKRTFLIWRKV